MIDPDEIVKLACVTDSFSQQRESVRANPIPSRRGQTPFLPLRIEAVGRRTHSAIEIEQFLVAPYFAAVWRRRNPQFTPDHHAAATGRERGARPWRPIYIGSIANALSAL